MPLARILTRFPEQAGALSEELRQHGYTVEFSSPELTNKPPADLEIDFEICAEPDALGRAADLADQLQADVAVSPGVLEMPRVAQSGPSSELAHDPLTGSATEALQASNVIPISSHEAQKFGHPEATHLEAEEFSRSEGLHMEAEEFSPSEGTAAPIEAAPAPLHEVVLPADMLAEPETPVIHVENQPEPSYQHPSHENDGLAEDAAGVEQMPSLPASESAKELLARSARKSATLLHAGKEAGKELWDSTRSVGLRLWVSALESRQELRERLNAHREAVHAERLQKIKDLEKRRVLAEERAAELEAAREAAALRLQQLLRERGGLTDAQSAPPEKVTTHVPAAQPSSVRFSARDLLSRIRFPFSTTHRPQLEAVLMGVAAACSLFVLGLAVASFHAGPAISSTIPQPASTGNANGGVTVHSGSQSGGVTVKAGTPTPAAKTAAARPSPAAHAPTQESPSVIQHSKESDVTIRNYPAPVKPSPRRNGNSDYFGSDVTIRHLGAQPAAASQSAPRAELKHYSDLDN